MHIVHGLTLADLTDEDLLQLREQLIEEGSESSLELDLVEEEICSKER